MNTFDKALLNDEIASLIQNFESEVKVTGQASVSVTLSLELIYDVEETLMLIPLKVTDQSDGLTKLLIEEREDLESDDNNATIENKVENDIELMEPSKLVKLADDNGYVTIVDITVDYLELEYS